MADARFSERLRSFASGARSWSKRAWTRTREGAQWTWDHVRRAPWNRIGIWTGATVGVLAAAFVLFISFADWNALKGPIARMASAATGREIVIRGDLDVDPWSWTPEIRVTDLTIGNPRHFRERGTFAHVEQAEAAVRWLPLFVGRFEFVRLDMNGADVALYRNRDGVSNWANAPSADRGRAFNMPAIRRFALRGGRVHLQDERRRMVLQATFTTEESVDPRNPGRFALNGEGSINSRPFRIELSGAPLLNVRRDRPYPFRADVHAGDTHIVADGAIRRPFDFSLWSANVQASGADLADLYPLIGLALPNTPPYDLAGRVERRGIIYGMPRVAGRVGDSDLRGQFTATRQRNGRLMFEGDFHTNNLDFDDMLAVLGGPPDTAETASAEQRAMAARLEAQDRFLPDARLDISRVRNMDARVSYRAARVRTERFPLRGLAVDVALDNGLLTLDPMTLDLNRGRLNGSVAINARQDVPRVDLDARLSNARLEQIFAVRGRPAIEGPLTGRARLSGRGASVRQAAANANGTVTLVAPSGEVREALAELTGINVVRGLGLLLADDQSTIGLRCGVASFDVRNGLARARSIVFDTETMLIRGSGTISLDTEALNLEIRGEPKEPRLIRVAAPITIGGRLRSPEVGVEAGDAAGQGAAALLASLIAPLAAILPFVDAGLAEHANCAELLAGRASPPREG